MSILSINITKNEEVQELIDKTFDFFKKYNIKCFINRCYELIIIPKINVYFRLEDVHSKEDFLTKVIAWVTYYGASNHWDNRYSPMICEYISYICETDFNEKDIDDIYCYIAHSLEKSREYVKANFDERFLCKCKKEGLN